MKNLKKSQKRSKTQRYNKKKEKDEILLKYIRKLEEEINRYKKKSSTKTKKKLKENNPFKLILFLDMLKNKRKRQIENETLKTNRRFISKKINIKSRYLNPNLIKKTPQKKKIYLKKKIFEKKRKHLKKIVNPHRKKKKSSENNTKLNGDNKKIKFFFKKEDIKQFLKKKNFQIEDRFIFSKTSFQQKKLNSFKPKIRKNSHKNFLPIVKFSKNLRYSLKNTNLITNNQLSNSKNFISVKIYENSKFIPKINLNNQKYKLKKILLKSKFINWVKVIIIINYIKKKTLISSQNKLTISNNYYRKNFSIIKNNLTKSLIKEINEILFKINNSILCYCKKNSTRLKIITTYNTYSVN